MNSKYSIYKNYIYYFLVIPFSVATLSIAIGYINYFFLKKDKEFLYINEANKIEKVFNKSISYIEKFSLIIANELYMKKNLTSQSISETLMKTYSIAKISEDNNLLTLFDFVDPNGKVIANAIDGVLDNPPIVHVQDRLWMALAPKEPWILHIAPTPVKGIVKIGRNIDYGIPVGLGITDNNDNFLGTISSGIDIKKIVNEIEKNLNTEHIRFIIINNKFELIAQTNNKPYDDTDFKSLLNNNLPLPNANHLSTRVDYDGTQYNIYKYMKDLPFIIFIGEDEYIMDKAFREKIYLPMALSFSIFIVLLILFSFLKNKLILPILELSDLASLISHENANVVIPNYNIYEINNLAEQLRKISFYAQELKSIKEKLELNTLELENYNEILEQKVKDRTFELVNALNSRIEFLTNMHHEIRTPIHGVINFIEILLSNWKMLSEDEKFILIQKANYAGEKLLSLINNLLDLSKFSTGQMTLNLQEIDLNYMIEDLVKELNIVHSYSKNITIEFSCHCVAKITGDKEKINQVLRNLFYNALKFSPDNSNISSSIECKKTSSISGNKSKIIHFKISDQGVGIPPNELKSIFNPFIQSSKTKTMAGGTGLGLAIAQHIIIAHQGDIWAENNRDIGATFNFTLPI
jgi:two-component system sensor histidine kinase ChiS